MIRISSIITGGQTGADIAGWRAAQRFGLPTSGWMPRGFITEAGPKPEYGELYGAREHPSANYRYRTHANVLKSDVCLLFTLTQEGIRSPGSALTYGLCEEAGTEVHWVWQAVGNPELVARWLEKHGKRSGLAVMIAGNRESAAPGIGAWVEEFLAEVFQALGYEKVETP